MAKGSKTYDGVPLGAVFESAQRALRQLDLEIHSEDLSSRTITAERVKTIWKPSIKIVLRLAEVGRATELNISTPRETLFDTDGRELIDRVKFKTDEELEKIRLEGRIAQSVEPVTYQFGQVPEPTLSPSLGSNFPSAGAAIAEAPKKGSGGSLSMIPVAFILLWLMFTESGAQFKSSLLRGLEGSTTDISQYDCERLGRYFEGRSVQNLFGAQSRIIEINTLNQMIRTSDRVSCNGSAILSNGRTQRVRIQVYRSDRGRLMFEVRSL
jgi:hypothetical protein